MTVSEMDVAGHEHHVGGDGAGHREHDHGDHAAVFRDRFWLSLLLAVPVVFFSTMVQDWFGYSAP